MGSKWRKAKAALGMNLCVYTPRSHGDEEPTPLADLAVRLPECSSGSGAETAASGELHPPPKTPTTPMRSGSGIRMAKSGSRSSKKTCVICLGTMKPGRGHALFTAECSHTFHFHCIASSIKHGNQKCPVCRAKWKEIPLSGPSSDINAGARINPIGWPHDAWMTILHQMPPRTNSNRQMSFFHESELSVFDDDEHLDHQPSFSVESLPMLGGSSQAKGVDVKVYPEFSAVSRSTTHENFTILVHLKAPFTVPELRSAGNCSTSGASPAAHLTHRAPIDLVTVLDVSGSMAGTKLALLKRAMGFVIQSLGPSDRLSVIAFSSTARRLFHLRRMTESGRQQALQAVSSLTASGGTNIAEGLRKSAKVMEDRKDKNHVCGIILLSDGQDTYSILGNGGPSPQPEYQSLIPSSIRGGAGSRIPVHTFGFGTDHDAASMHSISEASGGTFSFIEAEGVIQDAFAQCIGGLLSVVVRELHIKVEKMEPGVRISSIKAGSYKSRISGDGCSGYIEVGDLYADEERDFLVSVDVPIGHAEEMSLVKVLCFYKDTVSKDEVSLQRQEEVRIQRPLCVGPLSVSIEVDRQVNRIQATEAMAEARALAEQGDLSAAVAVLESRRRALLESASARAADQLCSALEAELKVMQQRMASRGVYEASGRAYVLSGLSSHSWQRATARGNSTESVSLLHAYQTPSMADMVARSRNLGPAASSTRRPPVQPARSFSVQPRPR